MSKELEKNYNPSEIEGRIYDKWMEKKQKQETIYYRYATTKYYR